MAPGLPTQNDNCSISDNMGLPLIPPIAPIVEPLAVATAVIGEATVVNNAIQVQFQFYTELDVVGY